MSDDKPTLDAQITRENEALGALNDIIIKFNGPDYEYTSLIEESLLIYLTARMAASANGENGEEHYPRTVLMDITKAGIDTGKGVIEQGRKDGTLPRPFKLIKPGMH